MLRITQIVIKYSNSWLFKNFLPEALKIVILRLQEQALFFLGHTLMLPSYLVILFAL
jgi:hypothetical protein